MLFPARFDNSWRPMRVALAFTTLLSAGTLFAQPMITGFTPTSAPRGAFVTIFGSGFSDATEVAFTDTFATFRAAEFTIFTPGQIRAVVPDIALTSGPIRVTTPAGSVQFGNFLLMVEDFFGLVPDVLGATPTAGPFGARVTVSGADFGGLTGVFFGGTRANFVVTNFGNQPLVNATLTATVPRCASSGPIILESGTGRRSSTSAPSGAFTFNVTSPPCPVCAPTANNVVDVTSQVRVTRQGYYYNFAMNRYVQKVILENVGTSAIPGPISFVVDDLTAQAFLANASGTTAATSPAGKPYFDLNAASLAPGARETFNLEFATTPPRGLGFNYDAFRVLAGCGPR